MGRTCHQVILRWHDIWGESEKFAYMASTPISRFGRILLTHAGLCGTSIRAQMAETFLIALTVNKELLLVVYSFLDDIGENPNFGLSLSGLTSFKHADISTASDALNKMLK